MGTTVELSVAVGDSVVVKQSALLGHIMVIPEPFVFDCMVVVAGAMGKIASTVAMCTGIVVKNLRPKVVVVIFILYGDPRPSQNMNPMFYPETDRMPNNLYPHAQLSDRMNNINRQYLTPSFTYSYIPHVDVHRLGICGTKV